MPKITHILSAHDDPGRVVTSGITGSRIAVYGRKDLKARLKAAKEAGVEVTVRKAPED